MSKQVLITGASRGIGKAIADVYRRSEYRVLAPSRQELDLSSTASIQNFLQDNKKLAIDVLINNAGENKINSLTDIALEDWDRILKINLTSAFLLMQHFSNFMKKKHWGRIVNISSCFSFLARPGRAAYSASKGGLDSLTRTAALEYAAHNVLINSVCPGFVGTDMTYQNNPPHQVRALCKRIPMGRLASTDEIAHCVFFLGSDANTYITGQSIVIDGGFSIA